MKNGFDEPEDQAEYRLEVATGILRSPDPIYARNVLSERWTKESEQKLRGMRIVCGVLIYLDPSKYLGDKDLLVAVKHFERGIQWEERIREVLAVRFPSRHLKDTWPDGHEAFTEEREGCDLAEWLWQNKSPVAAAFIMDLTTTPITGLDFPAEYSEVWLYRAPYSGLQATEDCQLGIRTLLGDI